MRSGVAGGGDIVGNIREGLSHRICEFLKRGTDFANCVLCAVVPGDARFAVNVGPPAVYIAERTVCVAGLLKPDVEGASVAVANLPLSQETGARWRRGVDSVGVGGRNPACGKLHSLNIGQIVDLAVAIFEDDHDGPRAALRRWGRRGESGGKSETK